MPDVSPQPAGPDFMSPGYVNTLTHFYRGELGRMMVWRQRFDATTNWAVLATGSLVAFAVGNPPMMNAAMFISLFVLGFFSFLEARRFRFYDAYRMRVRLLETHFIAPTLLGQNRKLLQGDWRERLVEDLVAPTYKCSMLFALGRRFKRVYFALHAFVLVSWFALVTLGSDVDTFRSWVREFRVQWVPGEVVLAGIALYYTVLFVLIAQSGALKPESAEVGRPLQGLSRDL